MQWECLEVTIGKGLGKSYLRNCLERKDSVRPNGELRWEQPHKQVSEGVRV